jgi:hypothetical protein
MNEDHDNAFDLEALLRITHDAEARREFLWLRAKEKEDIATARDLERLDPGVVDRLRAAGLDVEDRPDESWRERRDRFGRLQDHHFESHACGGRAKYR